MSFSRIFCQMIRVISSPSISTTGFLTLIFAIADEPLRANLRGDAAECAGAVDLEIVGAVLVPEGVAADNDRLRPAGYQSRHVVDHDRRPKDGAAQDVPNGAVRRQPHLLEVEFFDARFVGRDGGALDADADLLDRLGGVDGDLIARLVALLDAKVVIQ